MLLTKLAIWSRKIHRLLVIVVTAIGLVMMVTGYKLHEASEGKTVFPFLDYAATRALHNQMSTIFSIVLGLMMFTGLFLYVYPWIIASNRKKTT